MQREPRADQARQWLRHSAEDLRAASHDLQAAPPLVGDVLFHCQQAVEKALKAFLAWHLQPFRRTHDLVEIGQLCVNVDAALEPLLRRAAPLTGYAWQFRYPGEPEEPTNEEIEEALAVARLVFDAIVERVPAEARP